MINAIFHYQFLQHALIAGFLASIVCGMVGVIIVEKKLVMMSGGIAHTSYGGVGLGYLLGFEPIFGAFLFSIVAALGIGIIKREKGSKTDVTIAMFWSLGMALGIFFISMMKGYPPDLSSYLFGNILSVTKADILFMLVLTLVVVTVVVMFYNDWKSYLFDEEFSFIRGIKTGFLEYLLLILIAITVVVLIRIVGIILVLSLLVAPAAISEKFSNTLKGRMGYAIIIDIFFCITGLYISYETNIASGAVVVILSATFYFLTYFMGAVFKK